MPNILLGVTGSVAAIRVPELYAELRARGWAVKIVATRAATYFFDSARIEPADPVLPQRNPDAVILDEDEWPGRDTGRRWERGEPVTHIELRRWADLFLIAPLDANTLAKLAGGLCDNCLTCVWRAWDPGRPLILAPAMNTLMWQHPITRRHLRQIALDAGLISVPDYVDETAVVAAINEQCPLLRIVPPQVKTLACGDEGVGAMAEIGEIVAAVADRLGLHGENQAVE
jgi:phosphopantothenoylcysteine decarboxylase